MIPKRKRVSRNNFPRSKPVRRYSFTWGDISLFAGEPGISVVVSKKAIKKAHDRNRAKRRVYSAFHAHDIKKCLVVRIKKEAISVPYKTLVEAVHSVGA